MNTPVSNSNSAFVSALKGLVTTLEERRDRGLTKFISADDISTLGSICREINDTNIHTKLYELSEILGNLGTLPRTLIVDDVKSLRAAALSLSSLRNKPPEIEGEPIPKYHDLNLILIKKETMFRRIAGYIEECSNIT